MQHTVVVTRNVPGYQQSDPHFVPFLAAAKKAGYTVAESLFTDGGRVVQHQLHEGIEDSVLRINSGELFLTRGASAPSVLLESEQALGLTKPEPPEEYRNKPLPFGYGAFLIVACDLETNAIVGADIWSSPEWEQSRQLPNVRTYVAYQVRGCDSFATGIDRIRQDIANPQHRYHYLEKYLGQRWPGR